jgi:serine/threonine-protein kinase
MGKETILNQFNSEMEHPLMDRLDILEHKQYMKEGFLLINRYRIEQFFGACNMGQVFLCLDELENKRFALKAIHPKLTIDLDIKERFKKDFYIAQKMDDSRIVQIYELIEDPTTGHLYYTMELVDGETLSQWLHKIKVGELPMSLGEVLNFVDIVADTLEYAHEKGILHRGLTPVTIMMLSNADVKLMDFGISATLLNNRNIKNQHHYTAPELLLDSTKNSVRSDIYSFGIIVYKLLTGLLPIDDFALPSQISNKLPKELDPVILKAIQQDPTKRFSSVQAFQQALHSIIQS